MDTATFLKKVIQNGLAQLQADRHEDFLLTLSKRERSFAGPSLPAGSASAHIDSAYQIPHEKSGKICQKPVQLRQSG